MVYTASKELREFVENGMKHNPFAVLSRLVYNGIYREIIGGRLRVSDNIVVSRLAEDLNLSRTPVKIAMEDLLEQSMLEKRDGNKLSVKRVTFAECSLLFEARMAIETKSAYLAARRMTGCGTLCALRSCISQPGSCSLEKQVSGGYLRLPGRAAAALPIPGHTASLRRYMPS